MLAKAVLLPEVLHAQEGGARYLAATLLGDLNEAGELVVSGQPDIESYARSLSGWPPDLRTQAVKRLQAMILRGRVILQNVDVPDGRCACAPLVAAGDARRAQYTFCSGSCCDHAAVASIRIPEDYETGPFKDWLEASRTIVKEAGEWAQRDMEQHILHPVFEWAKRVVVVDRHIGRSMLGDGFRNTITWMAGAYLRYGTRREKRLRVVTSVECGSDAAIVERQLSGYRNELARRFPTLKFEYTLYQDRPGTEMPHRRYLVTNQVVLHMDRSFELLGPRRGDQRELRDVIVTRLALSPDEVEAGVGRLLGKPIARHQE